MSNNKDIDSVEKLEETVIEPITPENHPEEFENINNVNDKKQPESQSRLLAVNDEFTNQKSNLLIKYFHNVIKQHLMNPEKEFILLVNTTINKDEYRAEWANDPQNEGTIFIRKPVLKTTFRGKSDSILPKPVFAKDAIASDYKTDEDGMQHFPTETLKLTEENYWISDRPLNQIESRLRTITFKFAKRQKIQCFGVNFHEPHEHKQVFDILYSTGQYDNKGKLKRNIAFKDVTNLPTDGIQIIEFLNDPIITDEITLNFKSNIAAINYIIVIENKLTDEQLEMFLSINSDNEFYEKAFKK